MYFQKRLGVSWASPKEYMCFKAQVRDKAESALSRSTSDTISSAEFKKRAAKRDGQRKPRER